MQDGKPSSSAFGNAFLRAAHQRLDHPRVYEDPLALRLGGGEAQIDRANAHGALHEIGQRSMRAYIAARSRFVEDYLRKAVPKGVKQYVVLGAGFETLSLKLQSTLNAFEVDFPATQAAKRALLHQHSIPVPANVKFVPADFENESLLDALSASGFELTDASFVSLMGVSYYLSERGFWSLITTFAALPCVSGIALDIFVPLDQIPQPEAAIFRSLAQGTAGNHEPYRLHLDPDLLRERLSAFRFAAFECLDRNAINDRYFAHRNDDLLVAGDVVRLIGALR